MTIEWKDDLSVNVSLIDGQHKELIDKINAFHTAIIDRRGKSEISRTLKFLEDYTVHHFSTEERYMDKYEYPDAKYHKQQHASFIETVGKLKAQYLKEGASDTFQISVQRFLIDWVILHIKSVDTKFGDFLSDKDVKEE